MFKHYIAVHSIIRFLLLSVGLATIVVAAAVLANSVVSENNNINVITNSQRNQVK